MSAEVGGSGDYPRRLTDFEALSFDCYGTLIDWETGILAVLGPWARARGLTLDDEALLGTYAGEEARAEREHPDEPYPGILARSFRAVGARLGAEVSDADAAALAASVPDWPAFGDSAAALAELSRHYQLIILSNVDRRSFAASSARLGTSFAAVVTAEDVGSYKPAQANFDALLGTLAGLHISGGKLLHVAQSLFHDHVPAKKAGLPTVWINRRHGQDGWGATPPPPAPVQPDWEFPSMAAFAAAVAGPNARPADSVPNAPPGLDSPPGPNAPPGLDSPPGPNAPPGLDSPPGPGTSPG